MSAWPDPLPEDCNERAIFNSSAETLGSPLLAVWSQLNAAHVMAPKQGSWGRYLAVMANEVRLAMIAQADHAAAVQAERAAAAEAMREACAGYHERQAGYYEGVSAQLTGMNAASFAGYAKNHRDHARDIRALPIPDTSALAAAVEAAFAKGGAEALLGALHPEFGTEWRPDGVIGKAAEAARREEREACAALMERMRIAHNDAMVGIWHTLDTSLAYGDAADAIRARSGGKEGA